MHSSEELRFRLHFKPCCDSVSIQGLVIPEGPRDQSDDRTSPQNEDVMLDWKGDPMGEISMLLHALHLFGQCQNADSSSLASVTSESLFPCNISPSSMRSDTDHVVETKITAIPEACADTAASYHVCMHRNSSTLPITRECRVCMYMLLLFGTTSVVSVERHTVHMHIVISGFCDQL